MRWYMGLDASDSEYFVLVFDDAGQEVHRRKVEHSAEGFADFGGWLNARIADGIELFASLERPHGRMVEALLDLWCCCLSGQSQVFGSCTRSVSPERWSRRLVRCFRIRQQSSR